jgi:hypothetical protein
MFGLYKVGSTLMWSNTPYQLHNYLKEGAILKLKHVL